MTEHPIIFSAPMIRAILDGRKTMTRRIVKPRKDRDIGCHLAPNELAGEINSGNYRNSAWGKPGDTLWVRETFSYEHDFESSRFRVSGCSTIWYWADGNPYLGDWTRPKPSIHMPRWASRITLRVTDVRVERLQEITEDDAAAEGCSTTVETDESVTCGRRKTQFHVLWDSLNAKRGYGWDVNPRVWVISFERVEPEIGRYKCRRDPVKECPQPDSREIGPDGKYVQD